MSSKKLYCYVDETGQDTEGRFFIVVTLLVGSERDHLEHFLEEIERESGKGKRKWIKTRAKEREKYLEIALTPKYLKGKIFYRIQKDTKAYEEQTVITIEQAIHQYTSFNRVKDYKITVVIDGLSKKGEQRVGSALRRAGIKIRKVRGGRDESTALLRLADMVAGLLREPDYSNLVEKLEKEKVINELQP